MVLGITLFILGSLPILSALWWDRAKFNKSIYKKETGNTYRKVKFNAGLNGEYETAKILEKVKGYHKILLNCYLPNGKDKMTEIDVIFIHGTGIYVLESKNYSGWIFGKEGDKRWTQTFPNGKKVSFYNPIAQNKTHMNVLQKTLSHLNPSWFYSLIVFSKRCELKSIQVESNNIHVFKRTALASMLKEFEKTQEKVLTPSEIDHIYQELKPYTQVDEITKQQHIERVSGYKQK